MPPRSCNIVYTEHEGSLLVDLVNYFDKQSYVDVTFVCKNGARLRCHKLVLMSVSTFLKSVICDWDGPSDNIEILLPDVDMSTLKILTTLLYDGVTKLNAEEVEDFFELVKLLGVQLPGIEIKRLPTIIHSASCPLPLHRLSDLQQKPNRKADVSKKPEEPDKSVDNSDDPDRDPLDIPDRYFLHNGIGVVSTGDSVQVKIEPSKTVKPKPSASLREFRKKSHKSLPIKTSCTEESQPDNVSNCLKENSKSLDSGPCSSEQSECRGEPHRSVSEMISKTAELQPNIEIDVERGYIEKTTQATSSTLEQSRLALTKHHKRKEDMEQGGSSRKKR